MSVMLGTADLAIRKPRVVLVSLVVIPLKKPVGCYSHFPV